MALVVKNPSTNAGDIRHTSSIPGLEDPLEEGMATHSSTLAWRIPGTEEPGRLHSPWVHKESGTTEGLSTAQQNTWDQRTCWIKGPAADF